MPQRAEWVGITRAVDGVREAWSAFVSGVGNSDFHGVTNSLFIPFTQNAIGEMAGYVDRNCARLPTEAVETSRRARAVLASLGQPSGIAGMNALLSVALLYKESLSPLVVTREALFVPIVERAFHHLRRSIAADPMTGERWAQAYSEGETACERLGAVHLLQHGIWAFKTGGPGARTDLVLGLALQDESDAQACDAALVLTEWKLVRDAQGELPDDKVDQAMRQAREYGQGLLGGVELAHHRYVVVVSDQQLAGFPKAQTLDGITYRQVNVAVRPLTPSRVR